MMMRFLPGLFNEGFDDMFHDVHNMKCDIKEKDGNYLLDIELPGYKKENIQMDLKDGYLTIQADVYKRQFFTLLLFIVYNPI